MFIWILVFLVLGVWAIWTFNPYNEPTSKSYKKCCRQLDLAECNAYGCCLDWRTGRCSNCDRPML